MLILTLSRHLNRHLPKYLRHCLLYFHLVGQVEYRSVGQRQRKFFSTISGFGHPQRLLLEGLLSNCSFSSEVGWLIIH